MSDVIEKMVEELFAVYKGRMDKDGVPWIRRDELTAVAKTYNVAPRVMGTVSKRLAARLGAKLVDLGTRPEEMLVVRAILQKHGDWTEEARAEYGETPPPVGIVAAAKRALGIAPTTKRNGHKPEDDAALNPFREAVRLAEVVEKLKAKRLGFERQIEALSEQIAEVDREIAIYKPLLNSMESLKNAAKKVKTEMEERACRDRGLNVREEK